MLILICKSIRTNLPPIECIYTAADCSCYSSCFKDETTVLHAAAAAAAYLSLTEPYFLISN